MQEADICVLTLSGVLCPLYDTASVLCAQITRLLCTPSPLNKQDNQASLFLIAILTLLTVSPPAFFSFWVRRVCTLCYLIRGGWYNIPVSCSCAAKVGHTPSFLPILLPPKHPMMPSLSDLRNRFHLFGGQLKVQNPQELLQP